MRVLKYMPGPNAVNLMNDAGQWQKAVAAGSSNPLSNSQCSVDVKGVKAAVDGNNLTVTWPITFIPAHVGTKQVFLASTSKTATPWTERGRWVVQ